MSASQPPDPHAELASLVGTRISQQLWRTMPAIAKALGPDGLEKATFTPTVTFTRDDETGLAVVIKFSSNIPVPSVSVNLGWQEQQMSLLPPDPPAEVPPTTPPPPPASSEFQGRRPLADEAGVA